MTKHRKRSKASFLCEQKMQKPRSGYEDVDMGVSENVVYPNVPNGFADHYPY